MNSTAMNKKYSFLFPTLGYTNGTSLILLLGRLIFGAFFLSHGIQKITTYNELVNTFPDPIGLGTPASLILTIFAEFACSIAFIFGFLQRLAVIPMAFAMFICAVVVHAQSPFAEKEMALVYMVIFILMGAAGAGKYSIDYYLGRRLNRRNSRY